jgi:stress response protein SCP2
VENQIKGCNVRSVNDTLGTGVIAYLLSDGNKVGAAASLVRENGSWKIYQLENLPSPTSTLLSYCHALESRDYQTAYNQLSSAQQSQQTEAQFAANFSNATVSNCRVSNVNDSAGTGAITYTLSNGANGTLYYTLVSESATWKINSERQQP